MVARQDTAGDAGHVAKRILGSLFLRWRRWLTTAVSYVRGLRFEDVPRRMPAAFGPLGRALRSPRTATGVEERRALATAGIASLAVGSILALALAGPLRVPTTEAAIAAAWTLAWAGLRLGILRLASPRLGAGDVGTAWAGGLLPEALAFADPLRLVALVASAWLTTATLQASGASVREARRAVAWAFGAEAVAFVARWIGSGVLLYVLVR